VSAFRAAHGAGADWRSALDACVSALGPRSNHGLGFVYLTDVIAERAQDVLEALRAETGIADWIGATGLGILGNSPQGPGEYYDQPAIAVLLADLPASAYRIFPGPGGDAAGADETWFATERPAIAIVHADPRANRLAIMLERLSEASGTYLLGGLIAARGQHVQIAGQAMEGGASGAWIARSVPITSSLCQGCVPIGPAHVASSASRNVIMEIDGRPALDVFKEEIGDVLARNLDRCANFIYAGLPVKGSDTGDYLVRNLTGIDPGRGWIAIGDAIESGDPVIFTKRERASAESELKQMLERLKQRLKGPIRGGLYFSCLSRGANLFGQGAAEVRAITEILGDVALAGFFANGEINHCRLYGHTGVLVLFTEAGS
jgi:small ligand-binding sensory domain FIST